MRWIITGSLEVLYSTVVVIVYSTVNPAFYLLSHCGRGSDVAKYYGPVQYYTYTVIYITVELSNVQTYSSKLITRQIIL